jgi:hypothetical protein
MFVAARFDTFENFTRLFCLRALTNKSQEVIQLSNSRVNLSEIKLGHCQSVHRLGIVLIEFQHIFQARLRQAVSLLKKSYL